MKSPYYKSITLGLGTCFYCKKNTNWILNDEKDKSSIFVCNKCFVSNTIKIPKKFKIEKILCVKRNQNDDLGGRYGSN